MASVHVEFVIGQRRGHEHQWVPARELDPAEVRAGWLASKRLSCCTLLGGFLISGDGEPWNDNAIDEISMAPSWLSGTLSLLQGATTAGVWAWEESSMTLIRRGEAVAVSREEGVAAGVRVAQLVLEEAGVDVVSGDWEGRRRRDRCGESGCVNSFGMFQMIPVGLFGGP